MFILTEIRNIFPNKEKYIEQYHISFNYQNIKRIKITNYIFSNTKNQIIFVIYKNAEQLLYMNFMLLLLV